MELAFYFFFFYKAGSNQQITLLSGIFTLVVFGMCVPVAGYCGAKKSDPNALSLFCFGEGLVATFGGCEFIITVLTVMSYLQLCDQCSEEFAKNVTAIECTTNTTSDAAAEGAAGGRSGRGADGGQTVSRAICEGVLEHWGFWAMVIVSGLIVLTGALATKFSMRLRIRVLEKLELPGGSAAATTRQHFAPTHVVPSVPSGGGVGVVATTTVIQSGMQHYDQQPVQGQLVNGCDEEIPRARAVV